MRSASELAAILPRRPREVVLRTWRTGALHWFVRLMLPFTLLIAVWFLLDMMRYLTLQLFGHTVVASVERSWNDGTSKDATCHIEMRYEAAGQPRSHRESYRCNQCGIDNLPGPSEALALRIIGSGRWPRPMMWSPSKEAVQLGFRNLWFPLLWAGVNGFLCWFFLIVPLRQQALLAEGSGIDGTIIGKRTFEFKGTYYLLDYSYQPPGRPLQFGSMVVDDAERWKAAGERTRTLVFYDPERPQISVAYEFCPYQIRGFTATLDRAPGTGG